MAGSKTSNLRVHVNFGYDQYYVDYSNKTLYSWSSWSGSYSDKEGSFSNEIELMKKIGKISANDENFYFKNPDKWDC